MSKDKMRDEFELAFSAKTASMLTSQDGYLPDEFTEIHLEVMIQDRDGDTYKTDIYRTAWWAWQASRKAMVIELPVINERDWAVTSDECAAMREGIEIMARRVESSGFKVNRPLKPAEQERPCPGCGAMGFKANCMQCIPY